MEIKFRVWWDNKMYYPIDDSYDDDAFFIRSDGMPIIFEEPYWEGILEDYPKAIPMLWTGLQDANGKDIYEGDILESTLMKGEDEEKRLKMLVEWDAVRCCFQCNRSIFPKCSKIGGEAIISWVFEYHDDHIVIGNVHENPELLGEL